ncbi:hypothetical protein [Streptomyces sp. G45]|uniref:hypothetical protein n=1 Tax=Streptomyces sp. G45 TaxID=3406627 RepID=UPI003C254793
MIPEDGPREPIPGPGGGRLARRPAAIRADRSQRLLLAAFHAFRQRHYQPYLQYAVLRLGRRAPAEAAVAATFTELAVSWHMILGSSEPAAIAWRTLHDHVDEAQDHAMKPPSGGGAARALERDAHLLHDELNFSRERAAEMMGIASTDLPRLLESESAQEGPSRGRTS